MKDWIMAVCPEIAEWQAEVIAVQVRISVEAEREACAKAAEGYADFQLQLGDDLAQWRAIGALAVMAAISERGQE